MTEKKEFQVNKNTPFWDASLTDQEMNRLAVKRNDGRRKTGIPRQLFPGFCRALAFRVSLWAVRRHTALRAETIRTVLENRM